MIESALRTPPADTDVAVTDSYIKAVNLNRKIITSAQLAQQSLYEMCTCFKEMRDSKLYKELGYQNFEEYCENEAGFKRRQVYNYISIIEKLGADNVQSIAQIGMTKLTLLSTLSEDERTEITDNNNLENTSVRELESRIKQMKAEKDKAVAEKSAAEADMANAVDKAYSLEKTTETLNKRIERLQEEIKELESRPVEVAVETRMPEGAVNAETLKDINMIHDKQIKEMQEDAQRSLMDNTRRHNEELERLQKELEQAKLEELEKIKEDYEKRISSAQSATSHIDDKETFKAYLSNAIDAANRLCDYIKGHADSENITLYREKAKQLTESINKKIEREYELT